MRELLDKKCLVMSCTTDQIASTLQALSRPPKLIITDSQVFHTVYEQKPADSLLTSFSVLMAGYKGDIHYYIEGASAIDCLTPQSRVLIAEACTHAPATEDIGRVKLPRMLRKKIGEELQIDIVAGTDFPEDLTPYHLDEIFPGKVRWWPTACCIYRAKSSGILFPEPGLSGSLSPVYTSRCRRPLSLFLSRLSIFNGAECKFKTREFKASAKKCPRGRIVESEAFLFASLGKLMYQ